MHTNLAGKNEVAVEFSPSANGAGASTNGEVNGTKPRGRKAAAGKDQLVEMRFYIPGTVTKKEKDEEGEEKSADEEDAEEHNAANLFYETLMDKAEIGDVAGATFATFLDVLHLTPRYKRPARQLLRYINKALEDDLMSICTKILSDYEAKPTITRFNTIISRNLCFCQNQTICTR